MDKILENIYNMGEREYDVFKFLVIWLLIAIGVTIYFFLRIPPQLAERQRIIDEYYAKNSRLMEDLRGAESTTENGYGDFVPEVIYYGK